MTSRHTTIAVACSFVACLLALCAAIALPGQRTPASASPSLSDIQISDAAYEHHLAALAVLPGGNRLSPEKPVTLARYRSAMERSLSCMDAAFDRAVLAAHLDATLEAATPVPSPDRFELRTTYAVHTSHVADQGQALQANQIALEAEASCRAPELDVVERRYQLDQLHDPAYVRTIAEGFVACIRDAGLPVGVQDRAKDVLHRVAASSAQTEAKQALSCVERYPSVNHSVTP